MPIFFWGGAVILPRLEAFGNTLAICSGTGRPCSHGISFRTRLNAASVQRRCAATWTCLAVEVFVGQCLAFRNRSRRMVESRQVPEEEPPIGANKGEDAIP